MKRIVACCALFVALTGCQLTQLPNPGPGPSPSPDNPVVVQERSPAAEIWLALAHAVQAKTIDSANGLSRVVAELVRNGDLTTTDVTQFDTTFPGITKADRSLTDADVAALKSLAK